MATCCAPRSSAFAARTWLPGTWSPSLLPTDPVVNPLELNTFDTAAASPLISVSLTTLAVVLAGV
ncbi:Uncharacterised protein [Mycobacterium tuberculosis]|nr:Uncharacterised protein [Mycobacterium tuberculosis]COX97026.1 Uncharacterised protein [Mycobacterium tuberculosis]